MATDEQLAAACVNVMLKDGVPLEKLQQRAPRGFWESVKDVSGDQRANLSDYWKKHKDRLANLIQSKLNRVDELAKAATLSAVTGIQEPEKDISATEAHTPMTGDNLAPRADTEAQTPSTDVVADTQTGLDTTTGNDEYEPVQDTAAAGAPETVQAAIEGRLTTLEDALQAIAAKLDTLVSPPDSATFPVSTTLVTIDKSQDPPSPPKEGKKFLGRKADIRARIDERLSYLFAKECERYGGNASRALDAILWRYFGKPRLSFEPETIPD